jgi:hypothetical protein
VRLFINNQFVDKLITEFITTTPLLLSTLVISDERVWDFEFRIGIFRLKYRGFGIGFGIEIGMKSFSIGISTVSNWSPY